jgi:hypothetical protein
MSNLPIPPKKDVLVSALLAAGLLIGSLIVAVTTGYSRLLYPVIVVSFVGVSLWYALYTTLRYFDMYGTRNEDEVRRANLAVAHEDSSLKYALALLIAFAIWICFSYGVGTDTL